MLRELCALPRWSKMVDNHFGLTNVARVFLCTLQCVRIFLTLDNYNFFALIFCIWRWTNHDSHVKWWAHKASGQKIQTSKGVNIPLDLCIEMLWSVEALWVKKKRNRVSLQILGHVDCVIRRLVTSLKWNSNCLQALSANARAGNHVGRNTPYFYIFSIVDNIVLLLQTRGWVNTIQYNTIHQFTSYQSHNQSSSIIINLHHINLIINHRNHKIDHSNLNHIKSYQIINKYQSSIIINRRNIKSYKIISNMNHQS
jgi:hypothetical protein